MLQPLQTEAALRTRIQAAFIDAAPREPRSWRQPTDRGAAGGRIQKVKAPLAVHRFHDRCGGCRDHGTLLNAGVTVHGRNGLWAANNGYEAGPPHA